jgi:hypothetical protein
LDGCTRIRSALIHYIRVHPRPILPAMETNVNAAAIAMTSMPHENAKPADLGVRNAAAPSSEIPPIPLRIPPSPSKKSSRRLLHPPMNTYIVSMRIEDLAGTLPRPLISVGPRFC